MSFLFLGSPDRAAIMRAVFENEAPDIAFYDQDGAPSPEQVRYLATWMPPDDVAQRYTGLELLFSTGAGVDQFDMGQLPAHVGLVRLIERALVAGMVEYVCGAVLALHRDLFDYADGQRAGRWQELPVISARERRIGILGTGELGSAVLTALSPFGFPLAAWSRTPRDLACAEHHSGPDGLDAMLARTDILICLLPLTAETVGILCRDLFEKLPRGASLINVGRGRHLVQQDLLQALDAGQIFRAVLDVADPEPLPTGHPFWDHPRIHLTPHIASVTDPHGAARAMIANIRRRREGRPIEGLVARDLGY